MMVDGVTCRPFSAATLPPLSTEIYDQEREKIISVSRERYARPRDQVEEKIRRWSGMSEEDDNVRAPLAAGNARMEKVRDRPANSDDRLKFDVTCSVCGRPDAVPFKPDPNRPIYCSDCLKKVRSGEIAAPAAVAGRERKQEAERAQETKRSPAPATSDLSGLGIEFEPVGGGGERRDRAFDSALRRNTFRPDGDKKGGRLDELRRVLEEAVKGKNRSGG